jgi:hypothetical protein
MKKSISISNLTLDLWLEYVRPAAHAAGILEEVPARDDWHEYTAEVIDEAAADEIAHCMYCACMNSHIGNGDYTSDGEARQMLYQLEVSMKYDLRHTAEVITLLYNALSAALNPETIEEEQEENTMTTIDKVAAELEAHKDRSAWGRGVNAYALELVEELRERAAYEGRNPEPGKECREWMLNGAQDWNQYSWGGSSLIYDGDIAERLCTPSELKKTRHGERRPNSREEWLDTQARALTQACNRVARVYCSIVTA